MDLFEFVIETPSDVGVFTGRYANQTTPRPHNLNVSDTLYSQVLDLIEENERPIIDQFLKFVNDHKHRNQLLSLIRVIPDCRYYYLPHSDRITAPDVKKEPDFDKAVGQKYNLKGIIERVTPLVTLTPLQKLTGDVAAVVGNTIYASAHKFYDAGALITHHGLAKPDVPLSKYKEVLSAYKSARGHDENNTDALLFSPLAGYATSVGRQLLYAPCLAPVECKYTVVGSSHDVKFMKCAGAAMDYSPQDASAVVVTTLDKLTLHHLKWIVLTNILNDNFLPEGTESTKIWGIQAGEFHNGEFFISNFQIAGWREFATGAEFRKFVMVQGRRAAVYVSYLKTAIKKNIGGDKRQELYAGFAKGLTTYTIKHFYNVVKISVSGKTSYTVTKIDVTPAPPIDYQVSYVEDTEEALIEKKNGKNSSQGSSRASTPDVSTRNDEDVDMDSFLKEHQKILDAHVNTGKLERTGKGFRVKGEAMDLDFRGIKRYLNDDKK